MLKCSAVEFDQLFGTNSDWWGADIDMDTWITEVGEKRIRVRTNMNWLKFFIFIFFKDAVSIIYFLIIFLKNNHPLSVCGVTNFLFFN